MSQYIYYANILRFFQPRLSGCSNLKEECFIKNYCKDCDINHRNKCIEIQDGSNYKTNILCDIKLQDYLKSKNIDDNELNEIREDFRIYILGFVKTT